MGGRWVGVDCTILRVITSGFPDDFNAIPALLVHAPVRLGGSGTARSGKTFISVAFSCIWLHFPLPEPSSSAFSQGEKGFAGGQGCEVPAFAGRRVESLLHADGGALPGTEWLSGVRRNGKTFNSLPLPSISTHFGRELGGFTLILAISPQGRWDLQGDGDARFPLSRERRWGFAVATHAIMVRDGWGYGARGSCRWLEGLARGNWGMRGSLPSQGTTGAGLTGCLRDVQHLPYALPLCDSDGRPCRVGQDDGRQGAC